MIGLRVLIVAVQRKNRDIVMSALARDRLFALRDCAPGSEAMAAVAEWRPDLVLTDGQDLLARMRADRRTAPIPTVFMTERVEEEGDLLQRGAAGVIAKPIDVAALPGIMRRYVRAEGYLASLRESFLRRLDNDANALSACRASLADRHAEPVMKRVNQIAHALAGAGGIYGFAGIGCESAALAAAAERNLSGHGKPSDVEHALDRLLVRITPMRAAPCYSAATA